MTSRYELDDQSWALIRDLVSHRQQRGRRRKDDRLMPNGIFWVLCSGARVTYLITSELGKRSITVSVSGETACCLRLCSNGFMWS
jgi:transposase